MRHTSHFISYWVVVSTLGLAGCAKPSSDGGEKKAASAAAPVSGDDTQRAETDAVATDAVATDFREADRQAIVDTLTQQAQAWSRGDLDAFMQTYEPSERLLFTAGGEVRRGFTATAENYARRYRDGEGARMGTLAFEILDVRGLGRDAAVVLGEFALTDTPQAGTGVFTLVLVRNDGRWQIVHDHTSGKATSESKHEGGSTSDER